MGSATKLGLMQRTGTFSKIITNTNTNKEAQLAKTIWPHFDNWAPQFFGKLILCPRLPNCPAFSWWGGGRAVSAAYGSASVFLVS